MKRLHVLAAASLAAAIMASPGAGADRRPVTMYGVTYDGWGQSISHYDIDARQRWPGYERAWCREVVIAGNRRSASWVNCYARYWEKAFSVVTRERNAKIGTCSCRLESKQRLRHGPREAVRRVGAATPTRRLHHPVFSSCPAHARWYSTAISRRTGQTISPVTVETLELRLVRLPRPPSREGHRQKPSARGRRASCARTEGRRGHRGRASEPVQRRRNCRGVVLPTTGRKSLRTSEADDGARTRDTWLGKPVLYRLSYVRAACIVAA